MYTSCRGGGGVGVFGEIENSRFLVKHVSFINLSEQ